MVSFISNRSIQYIYQVVSATYNIGRPVNQIGYCVQPYMLSKKGLAVKKVKRSIVIQLMCLQSIIQCQQNAKNKTCSYITLCFPNK